MKWKFSRVRFFINLLNTQCSLSWLKVRVVITKYEPNISVVVTVLFTFIDIKKLISKLYAIHSDRIQLVVFQY